MLETYKAVPGFGGMYLVTDQGRVFSKHPPARHLKPVRKRDGYLAVNLCGGGKRRMVAVHRLVLDAFCGPAPEGLEASHLDGNRGNNALSNLRYETHASNCQRRRDHGTQAVNRGSAKVAEALVPYIREMAADGVSQADIGRHLKLHRGTVGRIIRRETYAHL